MRDLLSAEATLCSSPVSVLEAGYSARNAADHTTITQNLAHSVQLLKFTPTTADVAFRMQATLFEAGAGRAVGVLDLLHAAVATEHGATLVHYDSDFELLGDLWPGLSQKWVLPRGSID